MSETGWVSDAYYLGCQLILGCYRLQALDRSQLGLPTKKGRAIP